MLRLHSNHHVIEHMLPWLMQALALAAFVLAAWAAFQDFATL